MDVVMDVDVVSGVCPGSGGERMKRTERLIALGEHLRGRRTGVTAQALAERFEVGVRTIYRDLDALRAASLPIRAESGPGGGYALDRGYVMPPINFSVEEAQVLVTLVDWVRRSRALPFGETLAAAMDRVRAALPESAQRALEVRQATLSLIGVPARAVSDEVRKAVERAWVRDQPLRFVYDGAKGQTHRQALIRGVVCDGREVLLNCTDLESGEERQFVLHRILSVSASGLGER
jgi:predicted DNA-binding transcriptional regulator YafY